MFVRRLIGLRAATGYNVAGRACATRAFSNDISPPGKITTGSYDLSKQATAKANQRDLEMRAKHHAFRKNYPDAAQPQNGEESVDPKLAHRKRLIYRSKQRGWLEVDLLMGSWATDNVMSLTEDELSQYELILNCETLDIYNLVTKQMEVPPPLQGTIMDKLQEYALSRPIGIADPEKYAQMKSKMSN